MMYVVVCLIVFSSGYIGNLIYKKYKNRVEFYETMLKFADFLILNIYHLNENIESIINNFASSLHENTARNFEIIKQQIVASSLTMDDVSKLQMCADLKPFEKKQVFEFLDSIGKSNTESQIHILESYKAIFEKSYDEAMLEKKQKGSIAMKISVSVGVVVCILIM